jgi:hypothetical protein
MNASEWADTAFGRPTKEKFATVPHWLIGQVKPGALELYTYIARRSSTRDGWCWFTQADFVDEVRPIAWNTYDTYLDALDRLGAVVAFKHWSRDKKTHKGRNAGLAFYRDPSLQPLDVEHELRIEYPTRVKGVLIPRRAGVLVRRIGSDEWRSADALTEPAGQTAISRDLARDERGRFTDATKPRSHPSTTEPNRDLTPDQTAISRGAELEPLELEPLVEQEPAPLTLAQLGRGASEPTPTQRIVDARRSVDRFAALFAKAVA